MKDVLPTAGFVKHNRARLKAGKREESKRMLLEFFDSLQGKATGLRGYVILDNVKDEQETLILTFRETKQDMDAFCQPRNKALADFVEKSKTIMDSPPERTDYAVVKMKI